MKGKTCVVTGGSRGLGYYMAKGFLSAGANRVYITGRKAQACLTAAKGLSEFGDCAPLPGNIGSIEEILVLAKALTERETSIDVLANNGATDRIEKLEDFSEVSWDRVMDLDVKSPFFLSKELIPLLSAGATHESTASVINIGSVAGICSETDTYSYAPSKTAVHQLTRNIAVALGDKTHSRKRHCSWPIFLKND